MHDFCVYVGSYLKVPIFEVPVEEVKKVCSKCGKDILTNFCPDCGGISIEENIACDDLIDYYSLIEGVSDEENYFKIDFDVDFCDYFYIGFNKVNNYHYTLTRRQMAKTFPDKANEEDWGDIIQVFKDKEVHYSLEYGFISYYN